MILRRRQRGTSTSKQKQKQIIAARQEAREERIEPPNLHVQALFHAVNGEAAPGVIRRTARRGPVRGRGAAWPQEQGQLTVEWCRRRFGIWLEQQETILRAGTMPELADGSRGRPMGHGRIVALGALGSTAARRLASSEALGAVIFGPLGVVMQTDGSDIPCAGPSPDSGADALGDRMRREVLVDMAAVEPSVQPPRVMAL
ncbi:hypothetical protein G7046_g3702 [Stylonectria norvegica]|nr:hypothetical protein G7046_g3702 [Stylonectria norvegica]